MRTFEVQGKGIETGRKRKRSYRARDEAHMRQLAAADGTEVLEFQQLPRTPPTDRQLAYAKDLGIKVPPDADINDVSNLISNAVEDDHVAPAEERHIAKAFGVETDPEDDRFLGTHALRERVHSSLDFPQGQTRWLVFRIAQDRGGACLKAINGDPASPLIDSIASDLMTDEAFIRSLKRRWGDATPIHADRTYSYREIVNRLCHGSRAASPNGQPAPRTPPGRAPRAGTSSPNILTVVLAIVVLVILAIAIL